MVLGSNLVRDNRFFSSPKRPEQSEGPPSLLYKALILGLKQLGVKLNTDVHLLVILSYMNVFTP